MSGGKCLGGICPVGFCPVTWMVYVGGDYGSYPREIRFNSD